MISGVKQRGRLKSVVLISGTGSNLKALIDAVASGWLPLEIVRVISNRADAGGIAHAKAARIPVSVISHHDFPDRLAHDDHVIAAIGQQDVQLIILAGYMRILGKTFTHRFSGRMINLHPSLLPLYKGVDTYNRALQAGDQEVGASIHIVTSGLDAGPVISQVRIPVVPGDTAESLRQRLAPMEHKLLVATVNQFCLGRIKCVGDQLQVDGKLLQKPLLLDHSPSLSQPVLLTTSPL